jgi:hypothetical protein
MFKNLIAKYVTDFVAKGIIAMGTIAVAKGIAPAETINELSKHLIEVFTIGIAIAATTGIKALNDNKNK